MSKKTKRLLGVILLTGLMAGAVTLAVSGTGSTAIKARQQAMETVGDSMGALAAIAKKEAAFDPEVVQRNAGTILGQLEKAATLFPEGSGSGDVETWAKAEAWSDAKGFAKAFDESREAARAMMTVTAEKDFLPALGRLGNSCKSCHQTYRRPKE